jgi:TonB family protein
LSGAITAPRAGLTALANAGSGTGKAATARQAKSGIGESGDKTAVATSGKAPGGVKLARSAAAAAAGKEPAANGSGKSGNLVDAPQAGGAANTGEQPHGNGAAAAFAGAGKSDGVGAALAGARVAGFGADTSSGGTRSLGGSGNASVAGKLSTTLGGVGLTPGQGPAGGGFFSGRSGPAALAPGEPGSTQRLAIAMQAVPAILEMRPGGARSSFRPANGEGGGGAPVHAGRSALAQSGGGEGTPLSGRGTETPGLSTASRQASVASGGGNPAAGGTLRGVKVAAVEQIRPDSQVQPLDVLAPSTYCPLPGHVQPDNRPHADAQDVTEKPAYASDSPSFAFPIRAWAYGHEGRVTVRVQVLADGSPGQMWIKQSSGSGILDVDAREQLAKYHFKPARKNGQPVTAWIDVPVDYRLNAEKSP